MKYASKLQICKGKMGAFQAGVIPPTWEKFEGEKSGKKVTNFKVTKEGGILLEMAPLLKEEGGLKYYDWANKKVNISLGIPDICKIMDGPDNDGEVKLIHDNKGSGEMKIMSIKDGKIEGTYLLSLTVTKGEDKMSSNIAMSAGEWSVFLTLLRSQVPVLLGWDQVGEIG